jgi:hypothetical protein
MLNFWPETGKVGIFGWERGKVRIFGYKWKKIMIFGLKIWENMRKTTNLLPDV